MTLPPATFRAPFRVVGERIFDRNGVMVAAKLGQYAPHWFPVGWVCFEGPNQAARYEAWRAWWRRVDQGTAATKKTAFMVKEVISAGFPFGADLKSDLYAKGAPFTFEG